jgi:hypothetical protein
MPDSQERHRIEPFWDAQVAIGAVIALDTALPDVFGIHEWRLIGPAISAVLLLTLMWITPWNPTDPPPHSIARRKLSLALLGLVVAIHVATVVALIVDIVGPRNIDGGELLRVAGQLWLATISIFAVLYWDLDRKGPVRRSHDGPVPRPPPAGWAGPWPDFLFPQMADDAPSPSHWMPGFVDYLYLGATNSTAFSPTDVMPLSPAAKLLMLAQSTTSFVLIGLVTARAVNVLS